MRRATLAAALIGAIAGCTASEPPPPVAYLHPSGLPAQASNARVRQPSGQVFTQLVDQLRRSGLNIEQADRARGLVVATYAGDPEQLVDCGWIVQQGSQGLNKVPGSRNQAVFDGVAAGDGATVTRNLKLDARTVVQVRPVGIYTDVLVRSVYVLTKSIAVQDPSGQQRGRRNEVISFRTGGKGKFGAGTVCQPTGKLELLALEALPRSSMVAATAGSTRSIGAVDESRLACDGADQPYCEALEITAPYRQANTQEVLGLRVDLADPDGLLYEGDVLTLDISFPRYDSYLQVTYIDRSGRVDHLMPGNVQLWPANAANYVQDTLYVIGKPFGTTAVLAIASERPLFAKPRPSFERATTYLKALQRALADLKADNPDMQIAANLLLVQTAPRGGTAGGPVQADVDPTRHRPAEERAYRKG